MTSAGLSGFAKGFATGFVNERNRRLDEQKDMDQMSLKYRLEELSKQKADWQKKQEEEDSYINDGKFVAKQVGDPSFAAVAAQYRKAGFQPDEIMKMYTNGNFKKNVPTEQTVKIDNPDVSTNRLATKIPDGVAPASNTPVGLPPVDNSAFQSPVVGEILNNVSKTQQPYETTPEIDTKQLDAVDNKAKQIAPSLFDYKKKAPESILTADDSSYAYVPDKKEIKFGSLSEEKYKLEQAIQKNDKAAIADQKLKVQIMTDTMNSQAEAQAKAQGKNVQYYAVTDKNGKFVQSVLAERGPDGHPVNPMTGQPIQLAHGMKIDKETNDDIRKIQAEFRKPAGEYDIAAESTSEAFTLGKKMTDLLDKSGNDVLATGASGVLQYANNAFTELRAAQQLFVNQTNRAKEAKSSNSTEDLSAAISDMEKNISSMEQQIVKLPNNVLSDKNAQIALDKTLFDNYTQLFAYKLALANGQSGNAQSNKDIDRFLAIIGNKDSNAQAVKASLGQILSMQKSKMDQKLVTLNSQFKKSGSTFGFSLGLEGRRMGDIIQDPGVRNYYNNIAKFAEENSQYTRSKFDQADQAAQPIQEQTNQPIAVKSKEEFDKLPSGTPFIDPEGNQRIKP